MGLLQIRFLGTGDAFGHGGRLQPCVLVEDEKRKILLDCGASVMISLHRFEVDPNSIEAIVLSHLHGDHFGGLPFFILDAQLHSKRDTPLFIAGPSGTESRLEQAMECLFPGSSQAKRRFGISIHEFRPEEAWRFEDAEFLPYEVVHASGAPALGLRVLWGGKTIAYMGDTQWTESLVPLARQADLLIAEAYFFEKQIKFHLDYKTLMEHLPELGPAKVVITHMSQDMLSRLADVQVTAAQDGMTLHV